MDGSREGCRSPAGTPASLLTLALALVLGSYQGPLCTPSHFQQTSLLPTPPPEPWIMSAGELEDRRLACFASLVSAHPVVSEGAALGQPPHLGQTDKKLTFPPCLATTPTILFMERDLLPPLQRMGQSLGVGYYPYAWLPQHS